MISILLRKPRAWWQFVADWHLINSSQIFDAQWYIEAYKDVRQFRLDPLSHYLLHGGEEGRNPLPLFDTSFYLAQVAAHEEQEVSNPLAHYLRTGWKQGLEPHPLFDSSWYIREVLDGARRLSPLCHYLRQKTPFPHDPGPEFSNAHYLEEHPQVGAAGINPGWHFAATCTLAPQQCVKDAPATEQRIQRRVNFRVDKYQPILATDHVLIYVAYCPLGKLSPLQLRELTLRKREGFQIVLVINSGNFASAVDPGDAPVAIQIVRENIGFDFGGWRHSCEIVGGLERARSVTFTNDSVVTVTGRRSPLLPLIESAEDDILFLTRNVEVQEHFQSYFFTIRQPALKRDALVVLRDIPYYLDKHDLIHQVEIHLADRFRAQGYHAAALFDMPHLDSIETNPTISHWEDLLDSGFPFFKLQAIVAGRVSSDDPALQARLGTDLVRLLQQHLKQRMKPPPPVVATDGGVPVAAFPGINLFTPSGALQAYYPARSQTHIFDVPFADIGTSRCAAITKLRILGIVHCFYLDVADTILQQLAGLNIAIRLLLTTDTAAKCAALEAMLAQHKLCGDVRQTPNRGRDVAPLLIEGATMLADCDVVLHLHTKKSRHDARYAGWGPFLLQNLAGSREIILSNLQLLMESDIGIVFSDHFHEVAGLRNWGFDFQHAKHLLTRLGVSLTCDQLLEFPTSTMFWARVDALRPLFELDLGYDDFEPENGQLDGTLAHAIERCLLLVAERAGYRYAKVIATEQDSESDAMALDIKSISYALRSTVPRLIGSLGPTPAFYRRIGEIYPVTVARSTLTTQRLNLVIPTLQPAKIFGGVASAVQLAGELLQTLGAPRPQLRVIVTSDDVDADSLAELSARLEISAVLTAPNRDIEGDVIVDLKNTRYLPVALRSSDLFFCTAWWTADLAFRLHDSQRELFGQAAPVIYLIQDFEPGFYPWSEKYVMAEATYGREESTVAIFNSEELANFMSERHHFSHASHLPYALNREIGRLLKPTIKRRSILVYGRPSVSRNLFPVLTEGLRIWQCRNPEENCSFHIDFVGESFDPSLISELENADVLGKLSLESYAERLNEAAIGLSLMVSPHPSYPPLEMASSGCITITNNYHCKHMQERSERIIALDIVTPDRIADSLDDASSRARFDVAVEPRAVEPIPTAVPALDWQFLGNIFGKS